MTTIDNLPLTQHTDWALSGIDYAEVSPRELGLCQEVLESLMADPLEDLFGSFQGRSFAGFPILKRGIGSLFNGFTAISLDISAAIDAIDIKCEGSDEEDADKLLALLDACKELNQLQKELYLRYLICLRS